MGHLEEEIGHRTREVERALLEEAAQHKADQAPPVCPVCGGKLSRVTGGHKHDYQTRFGVVRLRRRRGWCRRCKDWFFPADHRLGVAQTGSCSPGVQEMAALAASKLPAGEASAVVERLSGVKLPRATLGREAQPARPAGPRAAAATGRANEPGHRWGSNRAGVAWPPRERTLHVGDRTGCVEHPGTRRGGLGTNGAATPARPGTGVVALGLWRHLFSLGPAGANGGGGVP